MEKYPQVEIKKNKAECSFCPLQSQTSCVQFPLHHHWGSYQQQLSTCGPPMALWPHSDPGVHQTHCAWVSALVLALVTFVTVKPPLSVWLWSGRDLCCPFVRVLEGTKNHCLVLDEAPWCHTTWIARKMHFLLYSLKLKITSTRALMVRAMTTNLNSFPPCSPLLMAVSYFSELIGHYIF